MKAIVIDHPDADNVLDLKQLSEICFRVIEHLNELWAKYDSLETNENITYELNEMFNHAVDFAYAAAWRIKNIHAELGDLPF